MKKVLFKEEQKFRQWWYIMLVFATTVPVIAFNLYALFQQTIKGVQVGDSPAPNAILAITVVALIILLWALFAMKLEVWIDEDGIHYRFFPLIRKPRIISKAEIQRYEIRQYNAILDYGGWGIKGNFFRKWGKAYNVSGNTGLQLYLTNGKKVLFGTQRSQAISYAMDSIMR